MKRIDSGPVTRRQCVLRWLGNFSSDASELVPVTNGDVKVASKVLGA